MATLEEAVNAIRMGDRETGRQLLEEILEVDENSEEVWLWLSSVVDTDEDREICLENVLALNPDNVVARRGLEALRTGTFNVHGIVNEALEEQEDNYPGATFLDEFALAEDDSFAGDEELEYPSTMAGARPKTKTAKRGLNIRLILLAIFILFVVLALGGAATFTLLASGGDIFQRFGGQPGQEVPTQEGAPVATATDTPIPTATNTPTPTKTPFELPTPQPTKPPTPTATSVVSPTPSQ